MQGILAHRYEMLEHVGGGGMADVYRARDTLLDRFVAVKVLHAQYAGDRAFVIKFRREAQGAAKLSHPNIVNIYDVGEEEGKHYIVMEYVSGETLKDKIRREGALPVQEALRIAEEIAQALEHAHQNNLVHCDIKPHNILVTESGRVKVADFGIARAVSAATMTFNDSVVGSVHYFSPEQAKGAVIGPKSDLYSLGVVLYEMIAGVLPFEGETPIGIALKHVQEEPAPLRALQPSVPAFAEAIVARAMAKEPEERYASATEMIEDIKAAEHSLRRGAPAPPDAFATQVLPRVGEEMLTKKKGRAGLAGALKAHLGLVALACILFFGFFLGAFLSYGKIWTNADIAVPDVVGKQLAVGKEILQSENLRVEVTEAYDDQTPEGYIVSQHPEANASVKEGRLIRLYVSKGGEAIDVPDVRGMLRRDAEIKLKNVGLHLGRISETDSDRTFDTVLEQNPAPGAQIAKGSAIDITISKGAAAHKIKLPQFKDTPFDAVKSQLETLGLKLGKVVDASGAAADSGAVLSQDPAAGTEVLAGTSVDFVLGAAKAQAPQGAQRSYDVALTVPGGAPKQAVRIVVTDGSGRRAVYENVHKPGDAVRKTVRGSGDMRVQVYVNGKLIQEETI